MRSIAVSSLRRTYCLPTLLVQWFTVRKMNLFKVQRGPIFANFVLADEINRAPAKVQSALLEAMQERQVTIGKETFILPEPFLYWLLRTRSNKKVLTRFLKHKVDRFMLKVVIDYPKLEEEKLIIRQKYQW